MKSKIESALSVRITARSYHVEHLLKLFLSVVLLCRYSYKCLIGPSREISVSARKGSSGK